MNNQIQYQAAQWEKITATAVALFVVGLISFLVIRDKPFSDPNFPVFIRILLSLACAVLGAVVPGFLNVDLKAKGLLIRAGGALALFFITFFFTPHTSAVNGSMSESGPGVSGFQARIEMLEATVKLLASAAGSPDTTPEDAEELKIVKSELETAIAKAKEDPKSLSSPPLDVAIVVGHSPMDPGAIGRINGHSYSEFSYNSELASILVRALAIHGLQSQVFFRDSSRNITSGITMAATRTPSLILELHANAYSGESARGCEAIVRADQRSTAILAESICAVIHESTGIPDRGVKYSGGGFPKFTSLYATTNKAILLESFFLTNMEDLGIATQEMDILAEAIARAIAENLNA